MSTEAKIGIALAVVALVAVLWFASAQRPGEGAPAEVAKASVPKKPMTKSERAKERLAQLRSERATADTKPQAPGQKPVGFPNKVPPPVFDSAAPAKQPEAPAGQEVEEPDFETLRDMALIDDDPDNRVAAIWLLASLEDDQPVLPVLTQALSDEDPEVRMAAIQALSEFSEETPIESLQTALQDSDAEIRFEALSIAAEMSDDRVQPLIQQALDDPDEDVRSLAEGLADLEETYTAPTPEVTPK